SISSASYFSAQWVRVTLQPNGQSFSVEIYRPDTNQYLNSAGVWQTAPAPALQGRDASISADGLIGLSRPAAYAGKAPIDDFAILAPGYQQNFDPTTAGTLPSDWSQWSSDGSNSFQATNQQAFSAPQSLQSTASTSQTQARAWLQVPLAADLQAGATVYLN